jgi:PAS domain S-box-containing protein
VESLPVCFIHKDRHSRFTFANQAFCAALHRPLAEVLGKTDFDFYPGELAHKYVQDDRRVLETGEVLEDVEEHCDPGGTTTYVQMLKAPLRDAHGQVVGVQGIYWDVTAAKRAEAELGRTAAEFRLARRIQQRLFPRSIPRVPGLDIAVASFGFDIGGASFPAEAIGGDYYDFVPLRDGSLGIAIGDVSGHGVGPALLMAEVRAYLRAFAQTEADVSAILGLMNRVLLPDIEDDRFITLLLAQLDPTARRFGYASAGHHPGYVLDTAGNIKRTLASTGTPLGVFPESTFPAGPVIPLVDGDLILLATDGVVEARAPDLTPFGLPRMLDLVRLYRQAPAREIIENLYHAVRAFAQGLPQFDDITATVVKVGEPSPA